MFRTCSSTVLVGLLSVVLTATAAAQTSAPTGLNSRVNEYLTQLAGDDKFSGVVLIAQRGKPVFHKAYGFANLDYEVPNKLDTKFNLGSINKSFTQLAIGMLIDEGKLAWDDKLIELIPDYPNQDAAKKITVKHLFEMRSGIGDFFGPEYFRTAKNQFRKLEDYLVLFADQPLAFEPGTKRSYSNGGYLVLGLIIERVAQQTYYDFVNQRIFQPLKMIHTDSYESDAIVANRATGYTFLDGEKPTEIRRANILLAPARGSSGGGGYSTAEDLLKFANGLQSGALPIPKSLRHIDGGIFEGGMGIAGGAPGISATLDTQVAGDFTVIVLSNYDPPIAESVSRQIRSWIRDKQD